MLYGKGMVWARPLKHFFEVVRSALHGLSTTLVVNSSHKGVLTSLLLILSFGGMIGGAFAGTLVLPCVALEVIKDRSDRLLS